MDSRVLVNWYGPQWMRVMPATLEFRWRRLWVQVDTGRLFVAVVGAL